MPFQLLTFDHVLEKADGIRHLLLGNGFSIACKPNLFRYDNLFNRANFKNAKRAREAFSRMNTTNFEAVIRALRDFSALADLYAEEAPTAKKRAATDADKLRNILVSAVADCHPDLPFSINKSSYLKCRNFLRNFKTINTLNYDLLLYWTMMQDSLGDVPIECDDGFRKPADDPEAAYVSWDPDNSNNQNIRYLHGALHLYDTGVEMKKFTWANTGVPLVEQIRAALKQNYYPVFVSEGTSAEKIARIRHNDYLSKMYRGFTQIQGSIIVYGHSLDVCDEHIFYDRIGRHGKTKQLFVSLYGDPNNTANKAIRRNAERIAVMRPVKRPLSVYFYDAESVDLW
jgi:hypothetical protein